MYNSSYTATNGRLGRDSVEGDVRDERATVGDLLRGAKVPKAGGADTSAPIPSLIYIPPSRRK